MGRGRARRSPGRRRAPLPPGPVRGTLAHHLGRGPARRGGHQRHGQVHAAADRGRRRPPRRGTGTTGTGVAGGLPRAGARAAAGDGDRCGGPGMGSRIGARPAGHDGCGRCRRDHPVGGSGQAGGPGPGPGPPGRAPGARRAHQPPRPGGGLLARTAAPVLPWRARPRDPRPSPARPGHHPDGRARPGTPVYPRRGIRLLPGGQGGSGRAGGNRGGHPPEPGPAGAGLAPARRPGPFPQAPGPGRRRRQTHRGPARGPGPGDRSRAHRGHPPPRRQGHRVRRRRVPLRRRAGGAVRCRSRARPA